MVPRSSLPYLGVAGLGVLFVSFALYGLAALAGDDRFGTGFGRLALYVFLVVGAVAVVVASVDLVRHRGADN